MNQETFTIQVMSQADLEIALSWAAQEGWNPGLQDAACFHAADPNGFLIGKLGSEPIASISGVAYGETFGFIGLYIVKPEYRGERYAVHLYKEMMKHLQGRNIGLDGVVQQQANYRKFGYRLAYRNIRYEGRIQGVYVEGLTDLRDVPFEKVLEYDHRCFPEERRNFLQAWIQMPNGNGWAKMEGDALQGFGVIRSCPVGFKIGPLFADSPRIAEELFLALAHQTEGAPIYLDTPEVNSAAVALADRYNMKRVFETARMYSGPDPDIDLDRIFGVTTFELG